MTKRIVLCADDYGQGLAINAGILSLVERQRLSAVSCLVTAPLWLEAAPLIRDANVDIGLHFNLTEGEALSPVYQSLYGKQFASLGAVMGRSLLRRWVKEALVAELHAQLDAFYAGVGSLPRFVDGHQHIHQFPIVRESVLEVYERRLRQSNAYLRLAMPKIASFKDFKQLVIVLCGAVGFKRRLEVANIPHNKSFSGSYAFKDANRYQQYFQHFLEEIGDEGLIMCHPALDKAEGNAMDLIAEARLEEYNYLNSDNFLQDCRLRGVKIGQFSSKVLI